MRGPAVWSEHYLAEAKKMIAETTDPGHRAIALGLVALAHAMLESSHDISGIRTAIDGLRDDVRGTWSLGHADADPECWTPEPL